MLARADFDRARRVELELTLAGAPGRVVGFDGQACGVVLADRPAPGVSGVLSVALALVLGPVHIMRRGRRLIAMPNTCPPQHSDPTGKAIG